MTLLAYLQCRSLSNIGCASAKTNTKVGVELKIEANSVKMSFHLRLKCACYLGKICKAAKNIVTLPSSGRVEISYNVASL
jgi:hypothetical protein